MLKVLKVGIAPYEEIKMKLLAVARSEYKFHKNEPRIWFSSIESLTEVLSTKNQLFLEILDQSKRSENK